MQKKLCLIAVFLCLFVSASLGQELFVRNDKYFTELYLKLNPAEIKSVDRHKDSVDIFFLKNLRAPFSQTFNDQFISSVSAKDNVFTVFLRPDAEFTVVNDLSGIKIVATKKKTNSDILSSYGVGNPRLSGDGTEDKAQEDALNRADSLIASRRFSEGAAELDGIIKNSKNDFYRQEAFYKLGQTYLLMSQYDDKYLANAYNAFDDFVKLYPNNFRAADAMMKSAEAKEKANQLFEAAFTYEKIYNSVPDAETKRQALAKMADIYVTVGRLDKAVQTYQTYLEKFQTDRDKVNAAIGQIYYDQREMDLAYEYFSMLDIDKIIRDPETNLKRLLSIAKNMELKKQYNNALKLYTALYEKFPDSPQANDAIFSSASILEATGRNGEADKLLLKLKQLFPDKVTGQQATIEYAKKYLNAKPFSYWSDFFSDLLSRPDDFGLRQEALYMLLKTMHRENNIDGMISAATDFLKEYPDSSHKDEINKMREDFMFAKASSVFNGGDYQKAEPLLTEVAAEYPESLYMPRVRSMLLDIEFSKIQQAYEGGKYKDVISRSENHIAQNPDSKELARWFDALDNARYRDLSITFASEDWPAARVAARQYLTSYPNGRHAKAVREMLEKSLLSPVEDAYKKGDYNGVIRLYEANRSWLNGWQNKGFKDRVATLAALSVYRLGSATNARGIYSEITPNNSMDYAILGLVLGDKTKNFDVNTFDGDTLRYVAGEVEQIDPDAAVALLKRYTKDPKLAASLEYGIAKNTPGDARRQELLMDVYEAITSNQAARFEGSQDVYLDIGLLYYRKNDFKGAVVPLKQYTDMHKEKDDKRAEALYYMGKSFVSLNDVQRGFGYYNEIIETMPESIYAGIAKSEMDEDGWKKNLNRF